MARSFAGADKIDCGAPAITSLIDYTFALWVMSPLWSSISGGQCIIFAQGQVGNGSFQYIGYGLGVGARITTSMDGSGVWSAASAAPSDNVWYHVAATLDAATQSELLYINGVAQGTPQTTLIGANGNLSANDNIKLGCGVNSNLFFKGSLADAAIWNAKLTVGEIGALAAGARPSSIRPASLRRYWLLHGLVSPEPEFSGSAKNGTVTGAALAPGPPTAMFMPQRGQLIDIAAAPSNVTVTATKYDNVSTFYAAALGIGVVTTLFANTSTFYAPVATTAVTVTATTYTNAATLYAPAATAALSLPATLFTETSTYYTPVMGAGVVTVVPNLFTEPNIFYGAALSGVGISSAAVQAHTFLPTVGQLMGIQPGG